MQKSWIQSTCSFHLTTNETDFNLIATGAHTPLKGRLGQLQDAVLRGGWKPPNPAVPCQAGTGHAAVTFRGYIWWEVYWMCVTAHKDFLGWSTGCVLDWFTANLVDLCSTLWNVTFLFKPWKGIGFACLPFLCYSAWQNHLICSIYLVYQLYITALKVCLPKYL